MKGRLVLTKITLGTVFSAFASRGFCNFISDKKYLEILFRLEMHQSLNLNNPKTFNEKIQWLKLYNRKPEYTSMVDKYLVREYISETIGKEYLIPLLGVWDTPDDIDFNKLPNQFVLKCNHDSGGLVICKDKSKLNLDKARHRLKRKLKRSFYWGNREWPYKGVKRKIIAEQYMDDGSNNGLCDYKIYSFNGNPRVILVCRDRFAKTGMTEDFFTEKWEHLNVRRPGHPNSNTPIEPPAELEEMLGLSRILSRNVPFLRTDFYIINHKVYFGELTFYPASGMESFIPEKFDRLLGEWLDISSVTVKGQN